jgi:hypothetical protein
MAEYAVHEPDYSDTTEEDWNDPQLNDFEISERSSDGTRQPQSGSRGSDDLGEVAEHFVLSSSRFPPETFSDLKVPVVDPDGNLNLDALRTAYSGGHSVERIEDIDDETVEEAREVLEELAEEGFGVGSDELESSPD